MKYFLILLAIGLFILSCKERHNPHSVEEGTVEAQNSLEHDPYLERVSSKVDYAQEIKALDGIWVAEDYSGSFDKTRSAVKSKNVFDPSDPVALRINHKEIKDGILNVGYSMLHDHTRDFSKYTIVDKDTLIAGKSFQINLEETDTLNYHLTTDIIYFNYQSKSYFYWKATEDTIITLYRPKAIMNSKEKAIHFKRIKNGFELDNPYPEPLSFYTRKLTLAGNYTLKDSIGKTLTNSLLIGENGLASGYSTFENKFIHFSTDVYGCLGKIHHDYILLCDVEKMKYPKYIYERKGEDSISLYSREWREVRNGNIEYYPKAKLYELVRN